MKMKSLAIAAAAFAVSAPVLADGKPTIADMLDASGITASGRIEAGYDYANTDGDPRPNAALTGGLTKGDQFNLHQAAINIAKTPASGVGGAVTLLAGEDAKALNSSGDAIFPLQAYLSYATGNLTVIGGRFLTLAGAEVIDSSANFNATRGILFSFQPTYHNGLRATYKVSDALSLTAGVVNSYNPADIEDNNQKTFEGNVTYTPITGFTNSLTVYAGKEGTTAQSGGTTLVDYVGTYTLTPSTTLALNADYYNIQVAQNDHADAWGVAGYVNQKLDGSNRVAVRAEYFKSDKDGIPLPARNVKGVTATFGHALTDSFEVVAEARADFAGKGNALFATHDPDTQYIGTVRAVYKF